MTCLRRRRMAGHARWVHACPCCDACNPSAPWGAWWAPAAINRQGQPVCPRIPRPHALRRRRSRSGWPRPCRVDDVGHDMDGGFFGRGAGTVDAGVGGPVIRARVQLVFGAQDEAPGSPISDLVIDRLAVGSDRVADAVSFGLVGQLALFTRKSTSQAFVPGLLEGRDAPRGYAPGALGRRV